MDHVTFSKLVECPSTWQLRVTRFKANFEKWQCNAEYAKVVEGVNARSWINTASTCNFFMSGLATLDPPRQQPEKQLNLNACSMLKHLQVKKLWHEIMLSFGFIALCCLNTKQNFPSKSCISWPGDFCRLPRPHVLISEGEHKKLFALCNYCESRQKAGEIANAHTKARWGMQIAEVFYVCFVHFQPEQLTSKWHRILSFFMRRAWFQRIDNFMLITRHYSKSSLAVFFFVIIMMIVVH